MPKHTKPEQRKNTAARKQLSKSEKFKPKPKPK